MEMKLSEFECADCGATINEGEYVTFGVCDKCFQKNYREKAAIKWLLDTLRPFENMEALGPLECFKIREIESLIKEPTSSGSVDAPKEEGEWSFEKDPYGNFSQFYQNKDFKFKALIRLPGTLCGQLNELASLRQQLKEREEALKETTNKLMESASMLDIIRDDMTRDDIPTVGYDPTDWGIMSINDLIQSSQAIIDRARKLILK